MTDARPNSVATATSYEGPTARSSYCGIHELLLQGMHDNLLQAVLCRYYQCTLTPLIAIAAAIMKTPTYSC